MSKMYRISRIAKTTNSKNAIVANALNSVSRTIAATQFLNSFDQIQLLPNSMQMPINNLLIVFHRK